MDDSAILVSPLYPLQGLIECSNMRPAFIAVWLVVS